MKKRDVILDFTSLLDVTLIVIFFFVLFSTLDAQQNKKKVDEAVDQYNMATVEAQERADQYEEALEIIESTTEKNNKEEIVEFNTGMNLKILLDISSDEDANHYKMWSIRVSHGSDFLETIPGGKDISEEINQCIIKAGYGYDDTILCDLIMDMSADGSNHAINELLNSLDKVKNSYYSHFYVSETDTSVGGK